MEFVSTDANDYTISGKTLKCNIGEMTSGTGVIRVSVKFKNDTPINMPVKNTATIEATNNVSSKTASSPFVTAKKGPDTYSISKKVMTGTNPVPPEQGNKIQVWYEIILRGEISKQNGSNLYNVEVTDTLPEDYVLESCTLDGASLPYTQTGDTIYTKIDELPVDNANKDCIVSFDNAGSSSGVPVSGSITVDGTVLPGPYTYEDISEFKIQYRGEGAAKLPLKLRTETVIKCDVIGSGEDHDSDGKPDIYKNKTTVIAAKDGVDKYSKNNFADFQINKGNPLLNLAKSVNTTEINPSGKLVYTIVYTNDKYATASDDGLDSDILPDSLMTNAFTLKKVIEQGHVTKYFEDIGLIRKSSGGGIPEESTSETTSNNQTSTDTTNLVKPTSSVQISSESSMQSNTGLAEPDPISVYELVYGDRFEIIGMPSTGIVNITDDGIVTYIPDENFDKTDKIIIKVIHPDGTEEIIEIIIDEKMVEAYFSQLPKTGGLPISAYMFLGIFLFTLGVILIKQDKDERHKVE